VKKRIDDTFSALLISRIVLATIGARWLGGVNCI